MSKRNEIIKAMKQQLDELNQDLAAMEKNIAAAKKDAQAALQAKMDAAKQQARELQAKIDEVGAAAEDRWEGLVVEGTRIRDAFLHSYNYLKSQLRG